MDADEVPLGEMCSSRWGDWISVPNHHLGNRWVRDETTEECLSPCPGPLDIPDVRTDPVTGESGYTLSEDRPDRCVSKTLYLAGRYGEEPTHCADAWIHRFGMTEEEYVGEAVGGFRTANVETDKERADRVAAESQARRDYARLQAQPTQTLAADLGAERSGRGGACRGNVARGARARAICEELARHDAALGSARDRGPRKESLRAACFARFPDDPFARGFRESYTKVTRAREAPVSASAADRTLRAPDEFWLSRVLGRVPGTIAGTLLMFAAAVLILVLFGDALLLVAQAVVRFLVVFVWPAIRTAALWVWGGTSFVLSAAMEGLSAGASGAREGTRDKGDQTPAQAQEGPRGF